MIKVAINGLGRIGRLLLRNLALNPKFEIILLNSLSSAEIMSHLIKYDSIHGKAKFECGWNNENLIINGKEIKTSDFKNPSDLRILGIDILFECSGKFLKESDRDCLINSGAKKIIISAPSKNADFTAIYGVNHQNISKNHNIISVGSCTTNALAPLLKIINDKYKILQSYATTIHAYTNDQNIIDNSHNDIRRARAAGLSMIPTKTGAASAIEVVIPELKGKISASAIRVPVPNVSLIDLVCFLSEKISKNDIDDIMMDASKNSMKGIISVSDEKLVSCDFNGSEFSSIYDPFETKISDNMLRILSWYDNEFGFVSRMVDVAEYISRIL